MSRHYAATPAPAPLQGRAYALDAASRCLATARTYRLQGWRFMASTCLRDAAAYRQVARQAGVLETYGIILAPTDIEWSAAQTPMPWRDHTAPTSRPREVRVERERQAWRDSIRLSHTYARPAV